MWAKHKHPLPPLVLSLPQVTQGGHSKGQSDQPSLIGPKAHPSEVIQEAWHCFARNKAETMSDNILVLVKVNCLGNCFRHDISGDRACSPPGFSVCGQGPPSPNLTATSHPIKVQVTLREPFPHLRGEHLPGSGSAFGFQKHLRLPKPREGSPFPDQEVEAPRRGGSGQVTSHEAVGQDLHPNSDSTPSWGKGELYTGTHQSRSHFWV